MHLISETFLFFALAFAFLFFLLGSHGQKALLLAGSYIFCGYAGLPFLALLLVSTSLNYVASWAMDSYSESARGILLTGIIANVLILGSLKYFNFLSYSFADASAFFGNIYSPFLVSWAIPLGLSFYTFQAISYLVDHYHGKVERPSFVDFAVFLAFWPKFTAGPIIRAGFFLPQLRRRKRFKWANLFLGSEMIVYGLFLKTVISDHLVPHIANVYETPAAFDGSAALLASLFFTFQIYGDFAGYSLIVIGIARILGFSVLRNFRRPNFARSFSDFWGRWHISLSTWLNDYIFRNLIPKRKRTSESRWADVRTLFGEVMRAPHVTADSTFTSLAGDSLSYVEVAIALEDHLGVLPNGWEAMTTAELDRLLAR